MPLYEYRCKACGERFEVLQRLGATSAGRPCPGCGREESEKVASTFASSGTTSGGGGCAPGGRFT